MKSNIEFAPLALLCLFTGKLLILSTWSFENALVLTALAAISAVFHIKAKNDDLKAINLLLEQQKNEVEELKKQVDSVKSIVTGMKMASSVKQVGRF